MFRILWLILMLTVPSSAIYAANNAGAQVNWGYKGNIGPARWGSLDLSFAACATGKSQSPINIIKRKASKTEDHLKVNYTPAALALMNDGTTTLEIGSEQTLVNEGHGVQVNFSSESDETITIDDNTYRLVQIHFHTPSENQLNGRAFPLEIDFVHQGDDGQIAVIGVFAQIGKEDPEIKKIIDNLPKEKGIEQDIAGQVINPIHLLPQKFNYYSFLGSLTTPPCSEGLQWIVMADPITISSSQVQGLKKAMGGSNARPVQALNNRKILFSPAEKS